MIQRKLCRITLAGDRPPRYGEKTPPLHVGRWENLSLASVRAIQRSRGTGPRATVEITLAGDRPPRYGEKWGIAGRRDLPVSMFLSGQGCPSYPKRCTPVGETSGSRWLPGRRDLPVSMQYRCLYNLMIQRKLCRIQQNPVEVFVSQILVTIQTPFQIALEVSLLFCRW